MSKHKFSYEWKLEESKFTKDKGKVFSCFACGGGSTMGYKLAGFDVIGCNEIDPRMNKVYVQNHHPKFNFICDIRELVKRDDLPDELFHLDILDGSPPCSSFSTYGVRERDWGKEKKFAEGQQEQILDTLFFDFIDLAHKLQPKVVVAENVKGMLLGEAKKYVDKIYNEFDKAGYYVLHFLLDAAKMGVPQRRERVFFVCLRKDLIEKVPNENTLLDVMPLLTMKFKEDVIPLKEVNDYKGKRLKEGTKIYELWENRKPDDTNLGDINMRMNKRQAHFGEKIAKEIDVSYTLTSKIHTNIHYEQPCFFSKDEVIKISTFPLDYDFMDQSPHYICGMSVPPVMMANVANNIWEQWLCNINSLEPEKI